MVVVVVVLVWVLFSHARTLREGLTNHFPPEPFFFLKKRSAHRHEFHSLGQDQSTVAKRAKMTVTERSLTSCV